MQPEGLPLGLKFVGDIPFILFGGIGRAINQNVNENYEKGKKILETIDIDEYDKKVRKTYKPKWHESARKASKVLRKLK